MAKKKRRRQRKSKLGLPPGTLVYTGDKTGDSVAIDYVMYGEHELQRGKAETLQDIPFRDDCITWINIEGLHNEELLREIGEKMKVPYLQLEDVLNINQRPKVEAHAEWVSLILKMVTWEEAEKTLDFEHMSIFCRRNLIITFQEKPGDIFDPIRERIARPQSRPRTSGSDYLFYALFDLIVDHYLQVLENLTDEIDELDDSIRLSPDKSKLEQIHSLKGQLISFRKAIWPLRFATTTLLTESPEIIAETTLPFLKDLEDHIQQVAEGVDGEREKFETLMHSYLSIVSLRMNEIMKVLTIIGTIFIPLTFLAGIYGMNFEYLPELKWHYGYFIFWGICLVAIGGMLYYFRRKGWI